MLMGMDLPRPKWPAHEIAVIGGQDALVIAGGYLRVAERAATEWSQNGPDDSLPIPIYYNYRHSVGTPPEGTQAPPAIGSMNPCWCDDSEAVPACGSG